MSDLKERTILLIVGAVIFVGIIFLFFNAVTANPEAFAIGSLLGGGIIGHLFLKEDGVWNPKIDGYPPYKSVLIVLGVCVLISWLIGSRPTTLSDCPVSVSRWCKSCKIS